MFNVQVGNSKEDFRFAKAEYKLKKK